MSEELKEKQKEHDKRLTHLETDRLVHDERHKGLEKWISRLDNRVRDVENNLSWQAKVVIVAIVTGALSFILNWVLGNVLS